MTFYELWMAKHPEVENTENEKGEKTQMETKMQIFENPEFGSVRSVMIDGEPWFVGKDVAEALGYGDGNTNSKALSHAIEDHVDDDDKRFVTYEELKGYQNGHLKNISHYGAILINESGLYSLIMGSKLPSAKRFKRWVTSEVLPALRKTGSYTMPQAEEPEDDFTTVCRALKIVDKRAKQLEARNMALESRNEALEAKIERDKPLVAAAEALLITDGAVTFAVLSDRITNSTECKIGRNELIAVLEKDGYLMRQNPADPRYPKKEIVPTQKSKKLGVLRAEIRTMKYNGEKVSYSVSVATLKGVQYFVEYFAKRTAIKKLESLLPDGKEV